MATKEFGRAMRVLVVDDDYQLASRLESETTKVRVELRPPGWLEAAPGILERGHYDLVLWHRTPGKRTSGKEKNGYRLIEQTQREHPGLQFRIITEPGAPPPPSSLSSISLPLQDGDLLPRLLKEKRRAKRLIFEPKASSAVNAVPFPHVAQNLRDPHSGRLNAAHLADFFGLHLTDVARLIGQKLPTLSRTPDAPSVQTKLVLFERIVTALLPLAGSPERARMWLNAPNPQLEGATPLNLLRNGDGDVVAETLEDMLAGQPA